MEEEKNGEPQGSRERKDQIGQGIGALGIGVGEERLSPQDIGTPKGKMPLKDRVPQEYPHGNILGDQVPVEISLSPEKDRREDHKPHQEEKDKRMDRKRAVVLPSGP
jgi:hypothetical protein